MRRYLNGIVSALALDVANGTNVFISAMMAHTLIEGFIKDEWCETIYIQAKLKTSLDWLKLLGKTKSREQQLDALTVIEQLLCQ